MSIFQFLKIFWARRLIVVAATISCLVGALIVTSLLPPRWEAHSRLLLNLMKPDPVTGEVIGGPAARVYALTQIELITDYSVAGLVAEQLGWLSDPSLIAAYERRGSSDQRDYRHWLAQIVIDNTKARLVQDSNIMEISYTGPTAANAKGVADALRNGIMDTSLSFRRQDAERSAEWFEQQSVRAKAALDAAITAKADYERANGIVMTNEKMDVESSRLQALSMQGVAAPASGSVAASGVSPADIQLVQADAQLASAAKILGPNNPEMLELRSRRTAIAAIAVRERAAARDAAGAASGAGGAVDRAMSAQKSKVIAQSDKIGRLTQLQNEVDLRRDALSRTTAKVAQYREEAAVGDAGITPLGSATTPRGPTFPNYLLIVPGSLLLGLAVGLLVALLMELFGRRVRSMEDMSVIEDVPVIGAITRPARGAPGSRTSRRPRLPAWPIRRRGAAPA